MAIAYLGSTAFAPDSTPTTSGAFDTSGATLIVATVTYRNGNPGAPTDSKGNTYTPLTNRGAAYCNQQMYYCENPTVGAGHTFTQFSSAASNNVSVSFAWFSGTATSGALDVQSGGSSLTGNITPSQANSLIVFAAADYYLVAAPATVSSPFTAAQAYIAPGPQEPACVAYYVQGAAAAVSGTWTFGGTSVNQVHSIAVFKPGAADTTPPTLTSPTATATTPTTASGSVSTNEANGTLYRYASTNATESVATVKASGSTSTVTATGTQSVTFTGLTPATTYYAHYVHTDAASNDSARVTSASFATPAIATLTSSPLKNNTGTLLLSQPFECYCNHVSTGALVLKKTGLTSHASTGVVTFQDAALTTGVEVAVRWRQTTTGAEGYERLTPT